MDSINMFRGYGKVDSAESPGSKSHPSNTNRTRLIVAAISSIFLLALLLLGTLLAVRIHESREVNVPRLSRDSSEVIKAVCSVTQRPDACFSSISSSTNASVPPDPLFVFTLSLELAAREVSQFAALISNTVASVVNESATRSALKDCATLLDDAASQLKSCKPVLERGVAEKKGIEDLKTWIAAAMTNEQTCVDGLEEMNSTMDGDFNSAMRRSMEYMSNSLAILANLDALLLRFHINIH